MEQGITTAWEMAHPKGSWGRGKYVRRRYLVSKVIKCKRPKKA